MGFNSAIKVNKPSPAGWRLHKNSRRLDLEILTPPVTKHSQTQDLRAIQGFGFPKIERTFTGYNQNSSCLLRVYYFTVANNG